MKTYLQPKSYITSIDEFAKDYDKPGLLMRVLRLPPEERMKFAKEVAQFRRAENGDRIRPDLLPDGNGFTPGEATLPNNGMSSKENPWGIAAPFSPRDSHRPDSLADPEGMQRRRGLVERIDTELATRDLQEKMGTDADRPLPEPTLRDQIEAAVAVHTTE